ncbi:MAG: ABC transporter permease [Bacteroidetes bacterium]|nr:ABC transporter permease [Bacteroidota bacterium]
MSFAEIRASKLRSFLSILGIAIGILCIISVRTAVNSLEMNIQRSLASFGNDILYVQKWPWIWGDGGSYPWWKYFNRPASNRRELEQVQKNVNGADASCLMYFAGNISVISGQNTADGVQVIGATFDYNKIKEMEFTQGRYFTPAESNNAQGVALIGANVAETLFPNRSQIEGSTIKVNGVKVTIIGVLKKEGSDLFGFTLDNNVIVPFSFMSMFVNMSSGNNDPILAVIPKSNVPIDELRYELKGVMRSARRLSPFQEDNFAINQVSVFTEGIASVFSIINLAGLFIGGFSIFVGAFGIANIMFVAVKERTYIIGIKKAIGAKKVYILLEFLLEAVVLCVLGGIVGLIVVLGLFQLLQYFITNVAKSDFHFYITPFNLMLGVSISVVVGILAGFIPAWSAANMKPVDAIRS